MKTWRIRVMAMCIMVVAIACSSDQDELDALEANQTEIFRSPIAVSTMTHEALADLMMQSSWRVAFLTGASGEQGNRYEDYIVTFNDDKSVLVTHPMATIRGNWTTMPGDGLPNLAHDYGKQYPFDQLNGFWELADANSQVVALRSKSDSSIKLILEAVE